MEMRWMERRWMECGGCYIPHPGVHRLLSINYLGTYGCLAALLLSICCRYYVLTLPLRRLRLQPIKHCNRCFFRVFPAFSVLFMDTIERTYNIDPSLATHRKKSPIRSMCRL